VIGKFLEVEGEGKGNSRLERRKWARTEFETHSSRTLMRKKRRRPPCLLKERERRRKRDQAPDLMRRTKRKRARELQELLNGGFSQSPVSSGISSHQSQGGVRGRGVMPGQRSNFFY